MKVESSLVRKLVITEIKQDAISVYLEDFKVGQGRIVITSDCDDSWSYYWGAMGNYNITQFFMKCDNHYLIGKLAPNVDRTIHNEEKIEEHLKKGIIKKRREKDIDKEEARRLFWLAEDTEILIDAETMYEVFGDEWWYELPQKPNPKYESIFRIVDIVKEALRYDCQNKTK